MSEKTWYVYVLVSVNSGRTYVGSSNDVEKRLRQHNGEIKGGARATIGHRPWRMAQLYGPYENRSAAFKAELKLKRSKRGKGRLSWGEGTKVGSGRCEITEINHFQSGQIDAVGKFNSECHEYPVQCTSGDQVREGTCIGEFESHCV